MIFVNVLKIIFSILGVVGTTFLLPIITAIFCSEFSVLPAFIIPMICSWILAAVVLIFLKKTQFVLSTRSAFVSVALSWICISIFGAIPLYASGAIPSITDAVFESVSGFSTTGSTILQDIESLPRSINLWRCQTHWLGGMGIVALTVALLPILGVSGFQLIKAESTGPEKGKLTPKITTTAKALWFIYFGLTVLQTICLRIAGMDFIDALSHAFSTVGTGGFSTRNTSIGAYNSALIDWICTVFMFLAGINFSMYYYIITKKPEEVGKDSEFKAYIIINIVAILSLTFFEMHRFGGFFNSLRYAAFQTTAILSTTGYGTSDYTLWSPASQIIIFSLFFIGGCSGSTSGGVKVIRWVVVSKQLQNEMKRMLHPHGIFSIRINQRAGRKDVVFAVTAFFYLYIILVFCTTLFASIFGLDILSSFTGAISMIGNVGPAYGALGPSNNYAFLATPIKWWYCFAMLAGRLELFTMLIFFTRDFWRK